MKKLTCPFVALLLVNGTLVGSAAGSEPSIPLKVIAGAGPSAHSGGAPSSAGAAKPASDLSPVTGKSQTKAVTRTAVKNQVTGQPAATTKPAATPKPMLTPNPFPPKQPAKVVGSPALANKNEPVPDRKAAITTAVNPGNSIPVKKRPRPVAPRRCEPQSLTYARQRSGIMTCRNGRENGPMTWFAAEKKAGRTSPEPAAGCVMILKGQGHGMPTGHVAYVEEVFPESPTTYRLIFSHTNYDRRCSMETNIEAAYDRAAMTLEVRSGAWRAWGKGLKVAGFIHDSEVVAAPPKTLGDGETTSQDRGKSTPPDGH